MKTTLPIVDQMVREQPAIDESEINQWIRNRIKTGAQS